MCGICGFTDMAIENPASTIKLMSKTLEHRGPDMNDNYCDEFIAIGHQRLSIIDLSEQGKQPMFNEDKTIGIVFNGEIFNYQEIKANIEKNHVNINNN